MPSTLGESTYISNTITFRGLNASDTTPIDDFKFKIKPASSGSSFDWDIRAYYAGKRLIFHLKKGSSGYDLNIGYEDDSLTTYTDIAETWTGDNIFTMYPDGYIYVDLVNQSINLTYNSATVGATTCTATSIPKISGEFNNTAFSWLPEKYIYHAGGTQYNTSQSLYNVTQHYFNLMAQQEDDISFNQCNPSGSQAPDATTSTMLLNYSSTGALTYLHITENKADVAIS